MQVEAESRDSELCFPSFLPVAREVTDEESYDSYLIARELELEVTRANEEKKRANEEKGVPATSEGSNDEIKRGWRNAAVAAQRISGVLHTLETQASPALLVLPWVFPSSPLPWPPPSSSLSWPPLLTLPWPPLSSPGDHQRLARRRLTEQRAAKDAASLSRQRPRRRERLCAPRPLVRLNANALALRHRLASQPGTRSQSTGCTPRGGPEAPRSRLSVSRLCRARRAVG